MKKTKIPKIAMREMRREEDIIKKKKLDMEQEIIKKLKEVNKNMKKLLGVIAGMVVE